MAHRSPEEPGETPEKRDQRAVSLCLWGWRVKDTGEARPAGHEYLSRRPELNLSSALFDLQNSGFWFFYRVIITFKTVLKNTNCKQIPGDRVGLWRTESRRLRASVPGSVGTGGPQTHSRTSIPFAQ